MWVERLRRRRAAVSLLARELLCCPHLSCVYFQRTTQCIPLAGRRPAGTGGSTARGGQVVLLAWWGGLGGGTAAAAGLSSGHRMAGWMHACKAMHKKPAVLVHNTALPSMPRGNPEGHLKLTLLLPAAVRRHAGADQEGRAAASGGCQGARVESMQSLLGTSPRCSKGMMPLCNVTEPSPSRSFQAAAAESKAALEQAQAKLAAANKAEVSLLRHVWCGPASARWPYASPCPPSQCTPEPIWCMPWGQPDLHCCRRPSGARWRRCSAR